MFIYILNIKLNQFDHLFRTFSCEVDWEHIWKVLHLNRKQKYSLNRLEFVTNQISCVKAACFLDIAFWQIVVILRFISAYALLQTPKWTMSSNVRLTSQTTRYIKMPVDFFFM